MAVRQIGKSYYIAAYASVNAGVVYGAKRIHTVGNFTVAISKANFVKGKYADSYQCHKKS
jgi:hypothetical protein